MIDFLHEVDGSGGVSLYLPAGGSLNPSTHETVDKKMHYIHQDGQAVYKFAVRKMAEATTRLLERNGITGADLGCFIPHQANKRIITATADRLGLPAERVIINIDRYGNSSSGTIPLAMETAIEEGKLKKGDLVLLAAVGAGFTVGTTLLRWERARRMSEGTKKKKKKKKDLFAFWADIKMLPANQKKLGPIADQIRQRLNIRVRPIRKSRFRQDIKEFLAIYNQLLRNNWGFSPMSDEALEYMARVFRFVLIPELVFGAEIDGRLVGIVLGLPDYNPRIKHIDGRLFPFGVFHLLFGRRRIKKIRIIAANVLPEYHLMGVAMVLMQAMVPMGLSYGIDEVEFSWVAESNAASRGAGKGGANAPRPTACTTSICSRRCHQNSPRPLAEAHSGSYSRAYSRDTHRY